MSAPLRSVFASIVVMTAFGCGSSSQAPATTVSGEAGGEPFDVKDAVGIYYTQAQQGPETSSVAIAIMNKQDVCDRLTQQAGAANAQLLVLGVGSVGASVAPGTYPITSTTDAGGGLTATALFEATNASCTAFPEIAEFGTITITSANQSQVVGSFDVTFPLNDHLSGHFSAPTCAASLSQLEMTAGATACVN